MVGAKPIKERNPNNTILERDLLAFVLRLISIRNDVAPDIETIVIKIDGYQT